jgi:hypothetical protein
VLTTDYNQPAPAPGSRFWFAKSTQQMVRQESVTPKGTLVKTLID